MPPCRMSKPPNKSCSGRRWVRESVKASGIKDEVLVRAARCSICRLLIPLASVALVWRDTRQRIHARACCHLYCRARVSEAARLAHEAEASAIN